MRLEVKMQIGSNGDAFSIVFIASGNLFSVTVFTGCALFEGRRHPVGVWNDSGESFDNGFAMLGMCE